MATSSQVSVRRIGEVIRIDFLDRNILDELNIHQMGEEMFKAVDAEHRPKVVIVFANVQHMSSAAQGTLIKVHDRVKTRDGQLRLCDLQPRIREGFKITRLDRLFSIHDTFDAALASFA